MIIILIWGKLTKLVWTPDKNLTNQCLCMAREIYINLTSDLGDMSFERYKTGSLETVHVTASE